MCEKCRELDVHIARCERLRPQLSDKLFLDGLEALVKSYREEKISLHPAAK